jgi:outer membrane immunogenic protein
VALAATSALATPAFAQDAGGIEAYAGVLAGYDHVVLKAAGDSGTKDGFVYGGVIGAQSTIGSSTVIGVEGEVTGATTKESDTDVFAAGDRLQLKAGRDFFVGARLGFRANPNVLVYAKGGYTNARVTAKYTDVSGTIEDGDNMDGYRIGAGVEVGEGKLRFRGEYRFSDYGDYKLGGVNTGISAQRHQVVLGAIYAF